MVSVFPLRQLLGPAIIFTAPPRSYTPTKTHPLAIRIPISAQHQAEHSIMVAIRVQMRHARRLGRCGVESKSEIPATLQPAAANP